MKKTVFILLCVFVTKVTFSQDLTYGVSLGPNVTTVLFDRANSTSAATPGIGFNFNGYINYQLKSNLGLVGSIGFDKKNVTYEGDVDVNQNYLNISPMLKFNTGGEYNKGFFIKSGIRYFHLLNAKESDSNLDVSESFNDSNFGIDLAFGMDLSEAVGFEFLFDYSLNDVFSNGRSKMLSGFVLININLQKLISKK